MAKSIEETVEKFLKELSKWKADNVRLTEASFEDVIEFCKSKAKNPNEFKACIREFLGIINQAIEKA